MALSKKLTATEIKTIMEATGRFEFMHQDERKRLWFWENRWEEEEAITEGISIIELMKWIVDFFKADSFEDGQHKVRTDIKNALGLTIVQL